MYKYTYLSKDCPEEKMDPPKIKKTKTSKPVLVDDATLNKMRLRFDQIKERNTAPGRSSSKIPVSISSILPPGITIKKAPESRTAQCITTPPTQTPRPAMNPSFTNIRSMHSDVDAHCISAPSTQIPRLVINPTYMTIKSKSSVTEGHISHPSSNSRPKTSHDYITSPTKIPRPVTSPDAMSGLVSPSTSTSTRLTKSHDYIASASPTKKSRLVTSPKTMSGHISPSITIKRPTTSQDYIASPTKKPRSVTPPKMMPDEQEVVVDLETLMAKLDLIEKKIDANNDGINKKLDALNSNGASVKRLVGAMSANLEGIRKANLEDGEAALQLKLPIESDAALESLEKLLNSECGEKALRKVLFKQSSKDMYAFMRTTTEKIFKNTTRYTWSGRVAKNSGHSAAANKASDLHVVRVLLDVAVELFGMPRDTCEKEFKKALINRYAAEHMHSRRDLKHGLPTSP